MTRILHIETATDICSVALAEDGICKSKKYAKEQRSHAEVITVLIQETLDELNLQTNALDAIAVSSGPGSYTGLRVGVSTAKGLCFGLGIPLIAIDTLEILAQAELCSDPKVTIVPMIDARRMEVYTAAYSNTGNPHFKNDCFIIDELSMHQLFDKFENIVFCGNGAWKVEAFVRPSDKIITSDLHAEWMCPLSLPIYSNSDFVDLAYFEPNYLKTPNITQSKKKKLLAKS